MDLDAIHRLEKGPNTNPNISEKAKWEIVLVSNNPQVVQNGLYYAQQVLQAGKGYNIFRELLYSDNDTLVSNTMHLLVNFANQGDITKYVVHKGVGRLLKCIDNPKLAHKRVFLVQFLANMLNDEATHDCFIKGGGLTNAVQLLSETAQSNNSTDKSKPKVTTTKNNTEDDENIGDDPLQLISLLLMIIANLVAARQEGQDYSNFSNKKIFAALALMVTNYKNYDAQLLHIVISILANLANTEENKNFVVGSGCITNIVEILRAYETQDPNLVHVTLTLLSNLLPYPDSANVIVEAGCVPLILTQITNSTDLNIQNAGLGALSNLATNDDIVDAAMGDIVNSNAMNVLIKVMLNTKDREAKIRSVRSIANLMANEYAQEVFASIGGIQALLGAFGNEKDEEIKLKIMSALFHMTMHNDALRLEVIRVGLAELSDYLKSNQVSLHIKKEITKAIINMSLAGDEVFIEKNTIKPLLDLITKSPQDDKDGEARELAAIALENLSTNSAVCQFIEESGGYEASVSLVKASLMEPANSRIRERSCRLIARFAVNSKMRQKYQNNNITQLLSKLEQEESKSKGGDNTVKEVIKMAIGNISVPHFESGELKAHTRPSVDEFSEFQNYNLDSDDEENFNNNTYYSETLDYGDYFKDALGDQTLPTVPLRTSRPPLPSLPPPPNFSKTAPQTPSSDEKKGGIGALKKAVTAKFLKKEDTSPTQSPNTPEKSTIGVENDDDVEDRSLRKEAYTLSAEEEQEASAKKGTSGAKMLQKVNKIFSSSLASIKLGSSSKLSEDSPVSAPTPTLTSTRGAKPLPVPPQKRPASTAATTTTTTNTTTFTTTTTTTPLKPKPPPDTDPEKLKIAKSHFKRTRIAQEILESEGQYIKNLQLVIKKYQNPLQQMTRSKKPLISNLDIRAIFSSVEIVFGYNSMLFDGLNQKMSRWSSKQTLGNVFLFVVDYFKVYTDYVNNLEMAQKSLFRLAGDIPKFSKWLEVTRRSQATYSPSLSTCLALPAHRLPQYPLLLREFLAATPDDHSDYPDIKKALEKFEALNNFIDAKKLQQQKQVKILELTDTLVGKGLKFLIQPSREYIFEVEVSWNDRKQPSDKPFQGMLYVFSDSICYTKLLPKKKQKIEQVIPILAAVMSWQGANLLIRYDALRTHIIEFAFQNKQQEANTRKTMDNLLNSPLIKQHRQQISRDVGF